MSHPPRILFLSGNAPPAIDGVGDYTDRLLEELKRQRPEWQWCWLSRLPRWFSSPFTKRQGVPLFRPIRMWNACGLALGAIRALNPQVLHVQEELYSFHETDAALRIARSANAFLVTTLHEFHSDHPKVDQTSELVDISDCVIANDPRTATRCLKATGRGVDRTLWSGATVLPPCPADRPATIPGLVVTFGFLSTLKSLEVVHDALKTARISRSDIRWRIIGPFEPETNPRHAALRDRFAADSAWIELVGAVNDHAKLRRLIAEAQAMLLPFADGASTRRGTLQIAWAFGLPVVTTPPNEPIEAVRAGENVLIAIEPEDWRHGVLSLLGEQNLAERLRRGGLESAKQFSWQRLAEKHLEIYDELLETDHIH